MSIKKLILVKSKYALCLSINMLILVHCEIKKQRAELQKIKRQNRLKRFLYIVLDNLLYSSIMILHTTYSGK